MLRSLYLSILVPSIRGKEAGLESKTTVELIQASASSGNYEFSQPT